MREETRRPLQGREGSWVITNRGGGVGVGVGMGVVGDGFSAAERRSLSGFF